MKNKTAGFLLGVTLCAASLTGCQVFGEFGKETVDYSTYAFTEGSWTREAEHDTETIRFGADGTFRYSCACGNPVNDSDLCEGYSYDEESKIIKLHCVETTDEMVTDIKVIKCDEDSLELDFGGEIRIFTKN